MFDLESHRWLCIMSHYTADILNYSTGQCHTSDSTVPRALIKEMSTKGAMFYVKKLNQYTYIEKLEVADFEHHKC